MVQGQVAAGGTEDEDEDGATTGRAEEDENVEMGGVAVLAELTITAAAVDEEGGAEEDTGTLELLGEAGELDDKPVLLEAGNGEDEEEGALLETAAGGRGLTHTSGTTDSSR